MICVVYVAQSLVFCIVLYRSFFPFSFGHNIVCPSMICVVYVAQSLVFCVVLYRSFFPFSFGHNIVCPSMICVVYVAQSLVFRVVFCRSLFGHCVVRTFSDARHLITSLVSSNISHTRFYLRYIPKRTNVLHIINFRKTLFLSLSYGTNVFNNKDLIKIAICNCILGYVQPTNRFY
jgi:hypothetical protein